jgi:hypothetical protein
VRHRKNLRVALATSVTLVAGTLATVAVTAAPAQAAPERDHQPRRHQRLPRAHRRQHVKWAGTVEQLKASAPTRWSSAPAT